MTLTFDFETKSFADLKKVGVSAYAEHPTTDVICACWGSHSGDIEEWWPGKHNNDHMPPSLLSYVKTGGLIEAHHAAFEILIWKYVMAHKYGWSEPALEQWRDTMAVAAYYAMPVALDRLARVLGFPGKNPDGARLITKYSKLYLKTAQEEIPDEDFFKFVDYCRDDVELEMAVSDELGDLPERELSYFQANLRMNLRGLNLDRKGIAVATKIVAERATILADEFKEITRLKPTQTKALMSWFAEHGLELENLQASTIGELLEDEEIPSGPVRRALYIRARISKASTKKLDAMARQCSADGRARWQTRYHGTITGRDTGSGFQPLNLNRGFENMDPDQLVRDIMFGNAYYLDQLYGDATDAVARASRYWIQAQPGNKIIAGDYSSIEAVLLACVAGEEWKINAFRKGVKIYEYMADKIHGLAPGTVTKASHPAERQDGKTGELAFGYQGALGAWLKFDSSGRHSDERIIEICKAWRAEHPATVSLWRGLESAAIAAVSTPGRETSYQNIGFEIVDEWLTMILLNGKRLWYRNPYLASVWPQWHKPTDPKSRCHTLECDCEMRPQVHYWAQKFGKWMRCSSYGGKWTENYIQASSREILMPAILRLENAGYPAILAPYDEIVAEVPEDFGSTEEFTAIMCEPLEWYQGWPIIATTWEGDRYRK